MQLKPEALDSLKLPVRVKAGFLGSVKLKVPWSRLGQEPVLVYLDRIFVLAEPATDVEGCSEDAVQEAKRSRVRRANMLQNAAVDLDDVTLSLSKDGYRDILKMADNFLSFNQRLRYAHYRPSLPVKSDPKSWWNYAYKVVTHEMKKASGSLSWEQLLRNARLRKTYVSLYASLLKSDIGQLIVDDNDEINTLDRELDMEVILQWRCRHL